MIWLISGFAFPFGEAGSELDPEERIAPLRLLHDALHYATLRSKRGLVRTPCAHQGPGARAPVSMAGLGRRWVGWLGLAEVVGEDGAWAGFGLNDLIGNWIDWAATIVFGFQYTIFYLRCF